MGPSIPGCSLDAALQRRLAQRESKGKLRRLHLPGPNLVDFSSNDYLSLSQDLDLRDALIARLGDPVGIRSSSPSPGRIIGSGGSRLLDGNSAFIEDLECTISKFHESEATLLFNSAYDANVGLISCVPAAEDIILYDSLIHASIHDGMRLSRSTKRVPFEHSSITRHRSDLDKKSEADVPELQSLELTLERLILSDMRVRSGASNVFICVEALYSMDGDVADLVYIDNVIKTKLPKGNGYIIVDEAHSIGVLGDGGRGLVCELGLQDRVWARVIGFGKAMGCAGGAILCSSTARHYLINYARTLIYTTAMTFPSLASIDAAYQYLMTRKAEQRRLQLKTLIRHCYIKLKSLDQRLRPAAATLRVPESTADSPIIPLFTTDPRGLAQYCQASGFMVRPIVAPTVPRGTERIRICLHAANTIEQVDGLIRTIETWLRKPRTLRDALACQSSHTGSRSTESRSQGGVTDSTKAKL
ncbi:PLP-dependent transferase [Nemania sp. FL0916]|nr:PLP-dependent transferase [Nemania sp. FL0916]